MMFIFELVMALLVFFGESCRWITAHFVSQAPQNI